MSYRVEIADTEHHFQAGPAESVLDAALRQGVVMSYSCRGGSCGACEGEVLRGEVAYLDGLPPAMDETRAAAGKALFCRARACSDLVIKAREIRKAGELPPRQLPCRIASMERANHDVVIIKLVLPRSERLQYFAGQYLDLLLRDGSRRSFSIANAPHDDEDLELHVRQVPGGMFSQQLFDTLQPKALLRLEAPLGSFFLREESTRPMLLLAGGTGFGPIKAMVEHARAIGLENPMHLYWGARAKADLYQQALAERWAEAEGFDYTPVLSEPQSQDDWAGRCGWVHEALLADYPNLADFDVYAAGPPPMITAAREAFTAAGLPEERLFYDSFDYAAG